MEKTLSRKQQLMVDAAFEYRHLRAPLIAYRIQMLLLTVAFPLGCFVSSAWGMDSTLHAPWQSGRSRDYVAMLLKWPGYLPFLPLIVFSQLCMIVWLFRESTGSRVVVRLGIYTGFLLSMQFMVFALMTSAIVSLVGALIVFPALVGFIAIAVHAPRFIRRFTIKHLLVLTTVMACVIAAIKFLGGPDDPKQWLSAFGATAVLVWQTIVMSTPTLCTIQFARASIQVAYQAKRARIKWTLAALAWLASWGASWKYAVDLMLEEYAKLPASNPNCYVSSAAANGHRSLVRTSSRSNINLQMRRLKFLELTLCAALPRCHRLIRRGYDRWGPVAAAACAANIWFADTTYLLLKPVELVSELVRITTGVRSERIWRIYGDEPDMRND